MSKDILSDAVSVQMELDDAHQTLNQANKEIASLIQERKATIQRRCVGDEYFFSLVLGTPL